MSVIEKVARAMCLESSGYDSWERTPVDIQEAWKKSAKAAIEAMREPSEKMVQAGIDEGLHKPGNWYPAMIDAALED